MNISEVSLNRPVLAVVMNLLIILFGIVGFHFLSLRDYPAIDPPIVNIRTNYLGANADIIESQITEPLEKSINGVAGIKSISSSSQIGVSNITVEFNLESDLEAAANDVRDKVSQAQRNLPQDIDAPPVVSKADASSDQILLLAVQSPTKGIMELTEYAENVLQQSLQTIDGVSAINLLGAKRYSMRIWFDADKMNASGISFNDISNKLNAENIELPAGKISGNKTELSIRSLGRLKNENDFGNLIIRNDSAGMVRLSNIARVELGPENYELMWQYNGVTAVGLAVIPQPGANYIKISEEFNKRMASIQSGNKSDITFNVLVDNTRLVRRSIEEVEETLLISFVLVVIVILFFFRDLLVAVRPLIDIPISLVATFFVMYLCGFSINILTLLGIVLATGLVVDDGIVVTENIFRKLEEGLPIRRAALEGSREIFFAVISTSLTLAVVFLPVIFLEGFVGSLFREFGIVVASAVLISAFVSLTITPVLNVLLNRKKSSGHGWFYNKTEPFFTGMENGYSRMLKGFMRVRYAAWILVIACVGIIWFTFTHLKSELAPMEDRNSVRLSITAPEGTNYEEMERITTEVADYLNDSIPEKDFTFSTTPGFNGTGVNSGYARIGLVPAESRKRSQNEITMMINKKLPQFNDARIFATQEQTISVGSGSRSALPVQFILQTLDFVRLAEVLPRFLEEARRDPTFQNVDVNLKFNKPEIQLTIDRLKASDLGLSTNDVAATIQSAFSGRRMTYFIMNGQQYQVIGQVARKESDSPADISKLYVRNNRGENIPLTAVVKMSEESSPSTLFHYNRYKSATISASLNEGKTVGDGVAAMRNIASRLLDETFQTSLSGPSRDFEESSSNTNFAFGLALLLVYLVLAGQFESFTDPLIIMITVPLALAGALFSLYIFDLTINIFSQIGMIMLIGLVTKNGILIVEFANQKRGEGMGRMTAVIESASQRLRPILMTSLATAFGALPIALSLGAAATSRVPLGVVIVGGLMFSLLLTLFVIPAIYTFISSKKEFKPIPEMDKSPNY